MTNRITGGGSARCLVRTESAGLGEGWSDVMAFWVQQKDGSARDYIIGDYTRAGGGRDEFAVPCSFADHNWGMC